MKQNDLVICNSTFSTLQRVATMTENKSNDSVGTMNLLQNTKPMPWMDHEFFETVIRHHTKDPNAKVSLTS